MTADLVLDFLAAAYQAWAPAFGLAAAWATFGGIWALVEAQP